MPAGVADETDVGGESLALKNYLAGVIAGAADPGTPQYVALRLSPDQSWGCDTACDGGCSMKRCIFDTAATTLEITVSEDTAPVSIWVYDAGADNAVLEYRASTELATVGDTIPDFSQVGYLYGADIPSEAAVGGVVLEVPHEEGDQTARIQQAIDEMAANDVDPATGFRGTVKLAAGIWTVSDTLYIQASGVVLSGTAGTLQGSFAPDAQPTTITATEAGFADVQREVLAISGDNSGKTLETPVAVTDARVPVVSRTFNIESASTFAVGDEIVVVITTNDSWISYIGMDSFPDCNDGCTHWDASGYVLVYHREITAIEGTAITLNMPMVQAITDNHGPGSVYKYAYPGRITKSGVQDINFVSVRVLQNAYTKT
eukprot:SAG22_NODE_330_length_12211_cov_6.451948_9_plen_374_part_00